MLFDNGQLNTLLVRLKAGDSSALDGILSLAGARMCAVAQGIVKNRADAEDIVQESFYKIARAIRSYRSDTNAYGWIMRIVRNTALDFLRRRQFRAEEDIEGFFSLADERYSPEKTQRALELEEAIGKLSAESKRMIYYRYYLDFTVREIAGETGMSKSAVQRAVEKAERELKNYLEAGQNRGGNV